MVGFDIPFAFVAAGTLSWRAQGRRPDLAMLYVGAGIAVPGLAFLEAYPDWDWQYFVDSTSLPMGTSAIFCGLLMIAGWAGQKAGACCPKVVVAVAALLGVFSLVTLPRTLYVGDRAAYLADQAAFLPMSFIVFSIPWFVLSGVVLAACVWGGERAREAGAT